MEHIECVHPFIFAGMRMEPVPEMPADTGPNPAGVLCAGFEVYAFLIFYVIAFILMQQFCCDHSTVTTFARFLGLSTS